MGPIGLAQGSRPRPNPSPEGEGLESVSIKVGKALDGNGLDLQHIEHERSVRRLYLEIS